MNPYFDIKTLTEYQRIMLRLKYNDVSYLTKASKQVIVNTLKRYSTAKLPVHCIGELMTLIYQSHIRNVAVNYLLVKLYSLREQRLIYRLIKSKKFDLKAFITLMALADKDTQNMFTAPHLKRIHDRKSFMNFLFTVKANVIFSEMLMLRAVTNPKYLKNHQPTNHYHHHVYRFWW